MDTTLVIGLVMLLVVGFFAYQWWAKNGRRLTDGSRRLRGAAGAAAGVSAPAPAPAAPAAAPMKPAVPEAPAPPSAETAMPMRAPAPTAGATYPAVSGQMDEEMRAPEPLQRRAGGGPPQGVGHESYGPVPTTENLRHPEALFRAPAQPPTMTVSDVPAGRAAAQSTPQAGNQQAFSPDMAQNGGALIGNTMFAFDGMEPTGFAAF